MAANYKKAVNEANRLLNSKNEYSTRPVNLATILQDLGLRAEYSDTITEEALLDPQNMMIYIRRDDYPITRKLFSIAHEIGHWLLHSRDKIRHRVNFGDWDIPSIDIEEEQEANAFAAELLMPYSEVRNLIMLGYTVENLMYHFNVSFEFASNRYSYIIERIY